MHSGFKSKFDLCEILKMTSVLFSSYYLISILVNAHNHTNKNMKLQKYSKYLGSSITNFS